MTLERPHRRGLIAAGGGLLLAGCDKVGRTGAARSLFEGAERLTMGAQRLVTDRAALAPEFTGADRSPVFRSNGNGDAGDRGLCAAAGRRLPRLAA